MAEMAGGACGVLYHHSIWGLHGMKLVGDRIPLIFKFLWFVFLGLLHLTSKSS
jgi:hypothetical protein